MLTFVTADVAVVMLVCRNGMAMLFRGEYRQYCVCKGPADVVQVISRTLDLDKLHHGVTTGACMLPMTSSSIEPRF